MNTTKETMMVITKGVILETDENNEECFCCPIIECYADKAVEAFGMCIEDEEIKREEAIYFMSLVYDLYNKGEYEDAMAALRGILHYGNCYELDSCLEFIEELKFENSEIYQSALQEFLLWFLDTDDIDDYLMENLLKSQGKKQTTRMLN